MMGFTCGNRNIDKRNIGYQKQEAGILAIGKRNGDRELESGQETEKGTETGN